MNKITKDEVEEAKAETAKVAAAVERELQKAAQAADPPVDVTVGMDHDFYSYDPHDAKMVLEQANLPYEPEKFHYRFVNPQPQMVARRKAMGYEMLPVSAGGSVLARLPQEKKRWFDKRKKERQDAMEQANTAQFEREVRQAGGIPTDERK